MIKKALVLVSMIAAMAVFAQDSQPQRPPGQGRGGPGMGPGRGGVAMMMDVNKDGKVSKEEVLAWFDKVDANKDGVLTEEELRAARPQGAGGPPANRGPRPAPEQK